jgi:flavin-dependent dehydrogenase
MMAPSDRELHFDVVILGGGPGGTAAGMTLLKRDGISVAVVEKSDYSTPRIGESLTPGIRPLLDYLDLWEPFRSEQSLESFGSQAAWGSASLQALDYMFTLHGTGWGLDRVRFDQMLANAFRERGGSLWTGTHVVSCERTSSDAWEVHVKDSRKTIRKIRCEYLIDATGRRGFLARHLGIQRTIHDRLVGVGCIGQLSNGSSLESVTQVEASEYGWWYTSPVPGNNISVVLMSDADIVSQRQATRPDQWQSLLNEMKLTSKRLRGVKFTEKPKAFPCFSSCLQQVGGKSWVAVGDAVASHDPLSSTGIPHAVGSGVHGAIVAANSLFSNGQMLESFQQSIHRDFFQYLNTHWQYYQRESRWPESLFWKRRRTPICIDPNATIERAEPSTKTIFYDLVHLPTRFSRQLYESCQPGRSAHQIVRAFANAHPQIPHQQVILGLQELVESGHVKIDSPKRLEESILCDVPL